MHKDFTMAIIQNDLDSMGMRIEALEAHPQLTTAGEFVRRAKEALVLARGDIHQRDMKSRFANLDGVAHRASTQVEASETYPHSSDITAAA